MARLLHTVVTCNDDFTDNQTNVPGIIARHRPLAVLVQEAKATNLRQAVPDDYGVRQNRNNKAKAGVGVAWDRKQARTIGTAVNRPSELGYGIAPIAYPNGEIMLTRYVVWQDVEVGEPGSGRYVRLASYHRPPKRFKRLWKASDRRLRAWVRRSPIPVILGMDANTPWLYALAKRTGFRAVRGVGIDCLMIRGRVWFVAGPTFRLARRTSDHHPIAKSVHIGRRLPRRTP